MTMPQYRAKSDGFYEGVMYGPRHKRRQIVHTETKLDPVPKWLEPMEDEKPDEAALRKRRTAAQKRADQKAEAEEKKMVKEVTFVGGPAASNPGAGVETL